MSALAFLERPARGPAGGLLVLQHGRGADERDLFALADVLDPAGRLHVVAPRGPLQIPGWPGYHWYVSRRVGHPDPPSFAASQDHLAAFHDQLWRRTGLRPEQTVLGGFSMGAVMSYALGLQATRPAPAGILALSGFVPVVDGWTPMLEDRTALRALVRHGRGDPVIGVQFGRRARELLSGGGLEVDYGEFDGGHELDPRSVPEIVAWLQDTLLTAERE